MITAKWDYTPVAQAYLKRPDYAGAAIDEMLGRSATVLGQPVCDVGAGAGHLTLPLAQRGLRVVAVEPNPAMAGLGRRRTAAWPAVTWVEAVAEETGQPAGAFHLVTFGSSFNVTDRPRALRESARILRPGGWLACLWNHRDLSDPIQQQVQRLIEQYVPGFVHGARREDQAPVIAASGLYQPAQHFAARVVHRLSRADYLEAWYSHCTLRQQAGDRFPAIVQALEQWLIAIGLEDLEVPYDTRVWLAQRRAGT